MKSPSSSFFQILAGLFQNSKICPSHIHLLNRMWGMCGPHFKPSRPSPLSSSQRPALALGSATSWCHPCPATTWCRAWWWHQWRHRSRGFGSPGMPVAWDLDKANKHDIKVGFLRSTINTIYLYPPLSWLSHHEQSPGWHLSISLTQDESPPSFVSGLRIVVGIHFARFTTLTTRGPVFVLFIALLRRQWTVYQQLGPGY